MRRILILVLLGVGTLSVETRGQRTLNAAHAPSLQIVPSLYDHNYTEPFAISRNGIVVVGSSDNLDLVGRPFRQSLPEALEEIPVSSPLFSIAIGVSANGNVVVGNSYNAAGFQRAFRWTRPSGTVELAGNPGLNTFAIGVSGNGQIVVGSFSGDIPCRWSAKGDLQPLDNTPGGFAMAADFDGSVIVGAVSREQRLRACRWTHHGDAQLLGDLGGESYALAVTSDARSIVGVANGPDPVLHACRWTGSSGIEQLDHGFSPLISSAVGVSSDGNRIVGNITLSTNNQQAFLWSSDTGLLLMDDIFSTLLSPGWTFVAATAISGDGRRIVGTLLTPERGLLGYILDTGTQ